MRWFEKQRVEFIGLTLQMCGVVNRKVIEMRFGISTAQASKDIQTYEKVRKEWKMPAMKYNKTLKRYERDDTNADAA